MLENIAHGDIFVIKLSQNVDKNWFILRNILHYQGKFNIMPSKSNDYASKAKELSKEQKERVLSRMTGKLPKRLEKDKLTEEQAIAIQLELEDEQLKEWQARVAAIRAKEKKKKK